MEWAYGLNSYSYIDHTDPEVNVSPLPCVIFRSLYLLVLVVSLDTMCSIDNDPIPRLFGLTPAPQAHTDPAGTHCSHWTAIW